MRPKRSCSIKSQKINLDDLFIFNDSIDSNYLSSLNSEKKIRKRRIFDSSSNGSDLSFKNSTKENLKPPNLKKSKKSIVNERILKESNTDLSIIIDLKSPVIKKSTKLLRSNSSIVNFTSNIAPNSKIVPNSKITPKKSPKKIKRSANVIKSETPQLYRSNSRYLLRSQSINCGEKADFLFRTPQPPLKITKKSPSNNRLSINNLSQISEYSTNSSNTALSASLLSRFIKKSKLTTAELCSKTTTTTTKRKYIRIIESSVENWDSSSCASVGEESLSTSINLQDPEKKILDLCEQKELINWSNYFCEQSDKPMNKIGEGVYGEVFRLNKGNVLKIFPVDGDILTNGEEQMAMEDVFSEVFVSKKLTELGEKDHLFRSDNFVQLKRASLLRGKLPYILINQWNTYKHEKGTDNECLDFLPEKQKWMALEYEFAGEPLASYKFNCYNKIRGLVEQISLSLAVAETSLQFEHRDLHWQNILIKPTKQAKLHYLINGKSYYGNCYGIFVTIIDFTVARMSVDNNIVYMDMADCPEIFEGEGDYQFEIYRMMKADNENNWREFHPRSNLYWLHYLIDKLLHETSYRRGDPHSKSIELELRQLYSRVLTYSSINELVDRDYYFRRCLSDF